MLERAMSNDLPAPTEPVIGCDESLAVGALTGRNWAMAGAITIAAIIIWWIGFLLILRFLVWLVLITSCVGSVCLYLLGKRSPEGERAGYEAGSYWLFGIAAGAVLGLLVIPKPPVAVTASNLRLAAATLVGRCNEVDFLSTGEHSWHGSAFVYKRSGKSLLLYTNAHCLGLNYLIEDSKWELDGEAEISSAHLTVTFPSGKVRDVLRMAASTAQRDIACLEVSCGDLREGRDYVVVPSVRNCLSRLAVKPGDDVIALGSPLDPRLEGTHTFGKISALREEPEGTWLQHDAGINPGNSGGPLFLSRRKKVYWIGINTLGLREGHSIGFSISADDVTSGEYQWVNANAEGLATLIRSYGVHARHVD